MLFVAVAGGAWPVVRRLTRRLEALKQGVEAFGAGALHQRVSQDGARRGGGAGRQLQPGGLAHRGAAAFAPEPAGQRQPRTALAAGAPEDGDGDARRRRTAQRAALRKEVDTNIAELDALVEEVLLASRLDNSNGLDMQPVALLAVAAEEGSRFDAVVEGQDLQVPGDERLLRRVVRNLLENAQRYGGGELSIDVQRVAGGKGKPGGANVTLSVCDRGPGVPEPYRERIFEPFFRLPGHAEREGGVGLGLALVRQIALRHGGQVQCRPREGGGSCFVVTLPAG